MILKKKPNPNSHPKKKIFFRFFSFSTSLIKNVKERIVIGTRIRKVEDNPEKIAKKRRIDFGNIILTLLTFS